jgi:hypothetical protein
MKKFDYILSKLKEEKDEGLKSKLLAQLEHEISQVYLSIKNASDLESAKEHFELLEHVQTEIARMFFREELDIPDSLKRFVRDFDRADDLNMQKYLFAQIKQS